MAKKSSEFLDNRSALPPAGTPMVQMIQGWPNLAGKTYLIRTAGSGMRKLSPTMRRREWFIRRNLMTEDEDIDDRKVVRRLREWKKQQRFARGEQRRARDQRRQRS